MCGSSCGLVEEEEESGVGWYQVEFVVKKVAGGGGFRFGKRRKELGRNWRWVQKM